jgi:DNA invertase Pin-like site-specific DNA recombinase
MSTKPNVASLIHATSGRVQFGALAEFERELNREPTRANLTAARARGRQGGRPKKLDTPKKIAMAQSLYNEGTHSINDICQMVGVSRATLYRVIRPRSTRPNGA